MGYENIYNSLIREWDCAKGRRKTKCEQEIEWAIHQMLQKLWLAVESTAHLV